MYVDPDGELKPHGAKALLVIRNTLPKEARKYVRLNSSGFLDKNRLSKYLGRSYNFDRLYELANSSMVVSLNISEHLTYTGKNGVNHADASHSFGKNNVDTNTVLSDMIKTSRRETIKNF